MLEVLVSMGVLSVGLLGMATLIPLGALLLKDTVKSDRTGACGRAAIHDLKVRRLLDSTKWSPPAVPPLTSVFVIDPLGENVTPVLGDLGPLKRINLTWTTSATIADSVFRWRDDLVYTRAKNYKGTPPNGDRPVLLYVQSNGTIAETQTATTASVGEFSWFLTVSPSISPQGLYTTSVVVCDSRSLTAAGEAATTVTVDSGPIGYGGVSIHISTQWPANWTLKANDWILLCSVDTTNTNNIIQATWYRIANVGYDATANTTQIALVGPDWYGGDSSTSSRSFTAVSVNRVTGVYTSTIQLDNDAIWTR